MPPRAEAGLSREACLSSVALGTPVRVLISMIWAGLVSGTSMWCPRSHTWLCLEWVLVSGHPVSAPHPTPAVGLGGEVAGGVASVDGVTLQAQGHSPRARAARCPKTACVGHPQASPSGQMALLFSVAAFLGADETVTCAVLREYRVSTYLAYLLCVGGSHSESSRVLGSWGPIAGLTSAALLVTGWVEPSVADVLSGDLSLCMSPCAVQGDRLRGVGGQRSPTEEPVKTQMVAVGDSCPRPSSIQATQLGLCRVQPRTGAVPQMAFFR